MKHVPPTAWATATQVFAQVFGLLVFAVLAPILGPKAFGLVAVVLVFVGFWEAVPGAAATDALMSIRDCSDQHYSSVTVAGAALGSAVAVAIWAAAGPLAAVLGDPDLASIMRAMAPLAIIQALAVAPTAAAQHDMRFDALTVRTVASLLAGGLAGLTLALMGAGVWALVWQALIQRSVAVLVLWSMAPHGFRPAPSARHLHELAAFALPNMASRIMSWASGQIPRLILGVYLGPTGLGLFSMATRLNEVVAQVAILPKATVARVALRRFAANPTALRQAFRRDILQISFFAFPICIGGSAIIRPVVDAWLGARWQGAIVPSELMLLLGIPFTTIYMSASLLLALNRQRLEAVICAVQSVGTVVAVACVAPYGVPAAVAAILACAVGTVPLAVAAIRRQAHIPVKCILMPQVPSLLAACCIGLVILVLRPPLEHAFRHSIAIPAEILAGAVTYAVMVCLLMPRTVRGAIDEFRGRFSPTPRRAA